jgi:hypothetical protein
MRGKCKERADLSNLCPAYSVELGLRTLVLLIEIFVHVMFKHEVSAR